MSKTYRIKPLAWNRHRTNCKELGEYYYELLTPFGYFQVRRNWVNDGDEVPDMPWFVEFNGDGIQGVGDCKNPTEAKAVTEAWYKAKLLEALEVVE